MKANLRSLLLVAAALSGCSSDKSNPNPADFFSKEGGTIQDGIDTNQDTVETTENQYSDPANLIFLRDQPIELKIPLVSGITNASSQCEIILTENLAEDFGCACTTTDCSLSIQGAEFYVGPASLRWQVDGGTEQQIDLTITDDLSDNDQSPLFGFPAGEDKNYTFANDSLQLKSGAEKHLRSDLLGLDLTGLVAYWDFDSVAGTPILSGDPVLANGFNYPLTAVNSGVNPMEYTDAIVNTGIKFFNDSILTTAVDDNFTIKGKDISLAAWVRLDPTGSADGSRVISKPFNATSDDYALILKADGIRFRLRVDTGGGTNALVNLNSAASLTPRAWYHVAATYDGTAMRLFVDGVLLTAQPETRPLFESQSALSIGDVIGQAGARSMDGAIDEISVWSRALQAKEVAKLAAYQNTTTGLFTSRIFNSGNPEQLWSALDWQRNSQLGTPLPTAAQLAANPVNSGIDPTLYVDLSLQTLFDRAPDSLATTNADQLITDTSGQNNNGTTDGPGTDIYYRSGRLSAAIDFTTSANQRINFGSDTSLDNIFAGGGTVALWFWPRSAGAAADGRLLQKGNDTSGISGYSLRVRDNRLEFEHDFVGAPTGIWQSPVGSLQFGAWHHIAISYDNSNSANLPKFYINGVELAATVITDPTAGQTADDDSDKDLLVGNSVTNDRALDGLLDELLIWQRALSSAEIKVLSDRAASQQVMQLRTCAQADCSDGLFQGSDGSSLSTFAPSSLSDRLSLGDTLQGQYLQYRIFSSTADLGMTVPGFRSIDLGPSFKEVTIEN